MAKKKGNSPKANNIKPATDEVRLGDQKMRSFCPEHIEFAVPNKFGRSDVIPCSPLDQYKRWERAEAKAQTSNDEDAA